MGLQDSGLIKTRKEKEIKMPQASLVSTSNVSNAPNNVGGGYQVGTAASDPVGFYGATPIVQPSTGATAPTTTAATTSSPWGFATSTQANAIVTLVNGLQTQLIVLGIISS
jgi:hypothetical protein